MQGQYGSPTDKTLRTVVSETYNTYGIRKGIMRGFWVRPSTPLRLPSLPVPVLLFSPHGSLTFFSG
jgi:hypothetical protein